jgi:hypothetical protein
MRVRVSRSTVEICSCLVLLACRDKPTPRAERPHDPTTIEMAEQVLPVIDGGVYVSDLHHLLYVTGATAVVVEPTGDSIDQRAFRETTFFELTPSTEGGAYASDAISGVWYLQKATATRVRISRAPLPTTPVSFDTSRVARLGWALYAKAQHDLMNSDQSQDDVVQEPDDY